MDQAPKKSWWQPAIVVFAEVTGWIAAPIIIALFLGRYLDEKFHRQPWFFLGCTALAIIISSIGIVLVAGKYLRQIEQESHRNDKPSNHERSSTNNQQR